MPKIADPPEGVLRLSASKVKKFMDCRMAYYWYYVERLVLPPEKHDMRSVGNLAIGGLTHELLHLYHAGVLVGVNWENSNTLLEMLEKEKPGLKFDVAEPICLEARRLMQAYIKNGVNSDLTIVSPEMHLQSPRKDWKTGLEYLLYARVDALARLVGERLWRLEFKTAARKDSPFINGYKTGLQAGMCYHLLEQNMTEKVHGTIYTILTKTKEPGSERNVVSAEKSLISRTLACCDGVARDILGADFYPSMNCWQYGRECEYKLLCDLNGSEQARSCYMKEKDTDVSEKTNDEEN